jgi:hypothetical protein
MELKFVLPKPYEFQLQMATIQPKVFLSLQQCVRLFL